MDAAVLQVSVSSPLTSRFRLLQQNRPLRATFVRHQPYNCKMGWMRSIREKWGNATQEDRL
jgi:hypothetical protein